MFTQIARMDTDSEVEKIDTDIDLHRIFTSASNFIKSPAEVETHRKVDLEDKVIKAETREKFHNLCNSYDNIIPYLKNNTGTSVTSLVEMSFGYFH